MAGQEFEIKRIGRGEYLIKRKTRRPNEGLVNLLLACPVRGWFQSIDRTEIIDDITAPQLA